MVKRKKRSMAMVIVMDTVMVLRNKEPMDIGMDMIPKYYINISRSFTKIASPIFFHCHVIRRMVDRAIMKEWRYLHFMKLDDTLKKAPAR